MYHLMSLLKQGKRIICVVVIVAVAFFLQDLHLILNSILLISFLANSLSLRGNSRSSSAVDATSLSSASISFFYALVSIFSLILLRSNTFSCSPLSDELINNFLFQNIFVFYKVILQRFLENFHMY